MKYLLGIDIGTSGTKTILFDTAGNVVASSTKEYPLYTPQNGWAEQDPIDWWEATKDTIQEVVTLSEVEHEQIVGIGLSGQMHGLVMLDEKGQVIRNAIIWCDQRTARQCEEINRLVGKERHIEIAANPPLTGFMASKILWVRENESENYNRCKHMLLPKDFIRYKLTGIFATEVSDASGTGLLDVRKRCWSDEILEKLSIDKEFLPKVYESQEVTGTVMEEVAALTHLKAGTIVVGGAGDNAAAAVGTGVVSDGKAFVTIGTSGVVFAHTSQINIDPKGRVHTFCAAVPGAWHVMGVTQAAGLSLRWLKDQMCEEIKFQADEKGEDVYEIMTQMANQSPIGAHKLLYLPYLNGERTPHLDPNCRGVFFGISSVHTKKDFIRAVMEGVTYSLKDCLGIILEMGYSVDEMIACGGGGKSRFWRQMLSDNFDCNVQTLTADEGPALGAAILAGVGAGLFSSVEEACNKIIHKKSQQEPIVANTEVYEKYYQAYQGLYRTLKENFKDLAKL